jgi:hypothetical protein
MDENDEYEARLQARGQLDAPLVFAIIVAMCVIGFVAFVRMF